MLPHCFCIYRAKKLCLFVLVFFIIIYVTITNFTSSLMALKEDYTIFIIIFIYY